MVTRFLTGTLSPQSSFTSTRPPKVGWKTTPDQLADMINQHKLAGDPAYTAIAESTAETARNRAVASVDHTPGARWPVAALAIGGRHWEVVHGFTQGNTGKFIVHARNPLPDRQALFPAATPPPHADGDSCDTLNLTSGGALEDEAVEWNGWIDDYFTACSLLPAKWKNKFIIVAPERRNIPLMRTVGPAGPGRGSRVADGHSAIDAAFAGLRESGLLNLSDWGDSLANTAPGAAYPSLHVQRLDGKSSYYLVALTRPDGRGALVAINEANGDFRSARLNPPPGLVHTLFNSPAGRTSDAERIVWIPCPESFFSPWFPFAEITDRGRTRYVRLFDQKSFDVLDTGRLY